MGPGATATAAEELGAVDGVIESGSLVRSMVLESASAAATTAARAPITSKGRGSGSATLSSAKELMTVGRDSGRVKRSSGVGTGKSRRWFHSAACGRTVGGRAVCTAVRGNNVNSEMRCFWQCAIAQRRTTHHQI